MIDDYLDRLRPRLRGSWWHRRRVLHAVRDHLGQAADALERGGMPRDEAERRAVERFGSAESTAALLRKPRRLRRRAGYGLALAGMAALGAVVLTHGGDGQAPALHHPLPIRWTSRTSAVADVTGYVPQGPIGAPRCRASQLRSGATGAQGAGGSLVGATAVINKSGAACTLAGVPRLALIDASGDAVTARQGRGVGVTGSDPVWQGYPVVSLMPGQHATLWFWWSNGCNPHTATAARVAWGRQVISNRFTESSGLKGYCRFKGQRESFGVSIWHPADAKYGPPPPAAAKLPLRVSVRAPARVRPGQLIAYTVTLANPTGKPVRFTSCPDYWQGLAGNYTRSFRETRALVLNCAGHRTIAAHRQVVYAMRYRIPAHAAPGRTALSWSFRLGVGGNAHLRIQ